MFLTVLNFILNRNKLAFLSFLSPKFPYFLSDSLKLLNFRHMVEPLSKFGEVIRILKDIIPAKHMRQQKFHEYTSRIPSEISMSDFVSSHKRSHDLILQPIELFPYFLQFGCSSLNIHNPFLSTVRSHMRSQVHTALSVTKVRFSAIRRCNINVMHSN